ncbi:hypothetical protein B6N17_020455 [Stutzerimonas stutzeri]|uniref:hypothetical protein n=1 Tax=Stutzerimonas stutzeri TaxID=316 RepID=UPI000A0F57FD|nr:hypothetical protein [Stutzerimonas stutzeri]OSO71362.1 hypothetical protein B6N17_020455 [Stutzerimonas stutzeri]
MNVSTINDAQEYRASMQRAALTFLQRHQAEHLTDDGHLFERAVSYLVNGLAVPTFMADRLVHLAMSELECRKRTAIGISYGTEDATRVALRSLFSGESVLIPLRHLPARLQPPAAPLAAAATH